MAFFIYTLGRAQLLAQIFLNARYSVFNQLFIVKILLIGREGVHFGDVEAFGKRFGFRFHCILTVTKRGVTNKNKQSKSTLHGWIRMATYD